MNESQPTIWWEKTVEYQFVLQADRECGLTLALPLSGVQELFSDGVFAKSASLVLIEFKRSAAELDSEKNKFDCYAEAEKDLLGHDGHHFLVYGREYKPLPDPSLVLTACTYFGREEISGVPKKLLEAGISPECFNKYLTKFAGFKKSDGRSTGKIGPESLATVVGISLNTKQCQAISLTEYYRMFFPNLYEPPSPTRIRPKQQGMRGV
ncbi:hypothetical protein [Leptothrix ochracea]|uniref:hypothetical protein n=1 Tax=Leptothrix ochracea TaxID=735331 RepID=UPI0034E2E874